MNQNLRVLRQRIRANAALPPPAERRRLRLEAGLPLAAVAAAAGVSAAAVSMWERGEREPAGTSREAYSRVLDVIREELGGLGQAA